MSGGIEGIYQRRDGYAVFEPVEVAGYPGVIALPYDGRGQGNCAILAGVAEERLLDVSVQVRTEELPEFTDPCPLVVDILEQMIGNLQRGS